MNQELPDVQSGKGKDLEKAGNQRSDCQHTLDHRKSKGIPKNNNKENLLLLH